MRLLAPTTVICLLLIQGIGAEAGAASFIDLTQGQWEVMGSDTSNWNGSDLFFETQAPDGEDFQITGYFDWYRNGTYRGSELFSGTYSSDGFLNFSGFQLINANGIGLANYEAEVLNSSQIINGTWGGAGVLSGAWSATNTSIVSEPDPGVATVPESISVFGLSVVALGGAILKQSTQRKAPQSAE
jgi:hypothetical protein